MKYSSKGRKTQIFNLSFELILNVTQVMIFFNCYFNLGNHYSCFHFVVRSVHLQGFQSFVKVEFC